MTEKILLRDVQPGDVVCWKAQPDRPHEIIEVSAGLVYVAVTAMRLSDRNVASYDKYPLNAEVFLQSTSEPPSQEVIDETVSWLKAMAVDPLDCS